MDVAVVSASLICQSYDPYLWSNRFNTPLLVEYSVHVGAYVPPLAPRLVLSKGNLDCLNKTNLSS